MRLYIIRHGETDWNKARKVQGRADIPLNAYGRHLAEETAEGMKDVQIDLAYTSPLIRARETAEIVLAGRKIPLKECEQIQEIGFGTNEGLNCTTEAGKQFSWSFFKDTGNYVPAEGGESVQDLIKRTGMFLEKLTNDPELQDKNILLSTHGAAMTALLNNIRGNLKTEDFWKRNVPVNCAVTTVESKNGKLEIVRENEIFYKEPVRQWFVAEKE